MAEIAKRIKAFFLLLTIRRFGDEWLFLGAGIATGLFALAASFARGSWVLDLFSNFFPQYFLGLLVCACGLLYLRRWRLALLLAPFALLCVCKLAPLYVPAASTAHDNAQKFKLIAFNVHSSNGERAPSLAFLERENPDFIVVTEFNDAWAATLAPLMARYKTALLEPSSDNFGIALYSRYAGRVKMVRAKDEFGLAMPFIDVALPSGRALRFLGVHSLVPKGAPWAEARNRCLLQCAELCKDAKGPALMAGDFNMTPFSPYFSDISRAGDLRSAAQGRGLAFTWPSASYLPLKVFSMQIDHCLISKEISVLSYELGPDLGSDHLPLIVEFAVR